MAGTPRSCGMTASVLVLFFLLSCSADIPPRVNGYRYIDPERALSFIKDKKAAIVDTMSDLECMDHRIQGSLCIASEEFDDRAPELLKDKKQPVIFYCESDECRRAGVSYDKARAAGYEDIYILEGGLPAWKRAGYEVETLERVKREPVVSVKFRTLAKLAKEKKDLLILDVRSEDAFKGGHMEGAVNIPLNTLKRRLSEIPRNRPVIVVDENGKRSFIVCCYLINRGYKNVIRLYGGMEQEGLQKGGKG